MNENFERLMTIFGMAVMQVSAMWIFYLLFIIFTNSTFDFMSLVFASIYILCSSFAIIGYFIYKLSDKDKKEDI